MRKSILTSAITTALLATGYVTTPAAAPKATPLAAQAVPVAPDAPLDARYLRQSELARAVVSSGNSPSHWTTPVQLQGLALADMAHEKDALVAWISSDSLASASARAEAARIVHEGVPVLVTHEAEGPRYEARTFGVDVPGSLVLYSLLPDGTTHIVTSGDLTPEEVSPSTLQEMLERMREALSYSEANNDPDAPVKKYIAEASSSYGTGASIAMHITVARDYKASHDKKNIVVVTKALVKPFRNGVSNNDWPLRRGAREPFRYNGTGYVLYAVGKYHLNSAIAWPAGAAPQVVAAEDHKPVSTGATEHNFEDTVTDSTTYRVEVSPEVGAELGKKGISAAGKIGGQFGYEKTRTEQHSVSLKANDYAIAVERKDHPQSHAQAIRWTYPMASRIANDKAYFEEGKGDSKNDVSTTRMTPMMRHADLETVSGWILGGAYEGEITLAAAADIENNVFVSPIAAAWSGLDYGVYDIQDHPPGSPCATVVRSDPVFGCLRQPKATITIDLGSPYLTPSPTVLLQSFAVDDGCLTQAGPASGDLSLATCDISEGNRKQQWTIDEEGRYVNRASQMCLQASDTGKAIAARCSQAFAQKWEWKADRIHSQRDERRSRLYMDGNAVSAAFDPGRHDDLPTNTTNALLPPWSSYPGKPVDGDYVPGFTARGEPIPPEYKKLRQVGTSERWKTIVLRAGLIR